MIIKKFRGGSSVVERRGASHPEVAGSNPAPRSIRPELQAFVAGLQMDRTAWKLGAADAAAGVFRLSVDDILGRGDDIDVLAYLRGWTETHKAKRSN